MEYLFSHAFLPLISNPTRLTSYSATLIDNIFTNHLSTHVFTGIFLNDLSGHFPICALFYVEVLPLCPRGGGGVLPYKGLMGTCGQPRYVFRDFCLEQGIEFIIFCLNRGIYLSFFVLNWVKCLKQGIKNRNSVLKWVGKSAIFVLNRVRV